MYLHGELLVVVGASFPGDMVADALLVVLLHHLLQAGFVVLARRLATAHKAQDEPPGRLHAAVQVDGGNDGLEGVAEDGGAAPPAADVLPLAKAQVLPKAYLPGKARQRALANQRGPAAGELPLGQGGLLVEEMVGHGDGQHRIAQKFEALVVGYFGFTLVGEAGVGEGVGQQFRVLEVIADGLFQRRVFPRRAHWAFSFWAAR